MWISSDRRRISKLLSPSSCIASPYKCILNEKNTEIRGSILPSPRIPIPWPVVGAQIVGHLQATEGESGEEGWKRYSGRSVELQRSESLEMDSKRQCEILEIRGRHKSLMLK